MKNIIIILCISALFGACKKYGDPIPEPLKFLAWNAQLDSAQLAQKKLYVYSDGFEWIILRNVDYIINETTSVQFTQGNGDTLIAYPLTGTTSSYIPTGEHVYEYYSQIPHVLVPPTSGTTIDTYWNIIYDRLATPGYCKVFYDAGLGKFYIIDDNGKKKVIE